MLSVLQFYCASLSKMFYNVPVLFLCGIQSGRMQIYIFFFSQQFIITVLSFGSWTEADTTVACRQLGFDHGNFSFFSWSTNDSMFMLYHKPNCNGDEQSVLKCPGVGNIKIGSRICS